MVGALPLTRHRSRTLRPDARSDARAPALPTHSARPPLPTQARALLVSAAFLVAGSSAGAVELTKSNFKAEVKDSGKNAFVKFLAPW